MKFCPSCGAKLPEGARFCENCGAAVAPASAPVPAVVGASPPAGSVPAQAEYAPPPLEYAPSSTEYAAPQPAVPAAAPKSRRGLVTAIGGVLAVGVLGTVGYFVYDHFTGPNGGADSPSAAVTQLSAAADSKDAVTALSLLPPGEVGPIVGLYQDVQAKASSTGVTAKDNPFAGFDLHVTGVAVKTDQLGPDVAAVTLTGGKVSWTLNPDQLQGPLRIDAQGHVRHASKGSADLVELTRKASHGAPLQLMTVRRDGKWYVSPMYTLLEAWRTDQGLPEPDFSKAFDYSHTGAGSATAVVQQAAQALSQYNVDGFLDLLSPDEAGALYQYRDAIITSLNKDGSLARLQRQAQLSVDAVNATAGDAVDGMVPVTVRSATGSMRNNYGDSYNWSLDRDCVSYVGNGDSHSGCLSDALKTEGVRSSAASDFSSLTLLTQQVDGRWYLSPMATVVTDLRHVVAKLDANDVAAMLRVPQFGTVAGQLTDGKAVHGSMAKDRQTAVYEMNVPAGKVLSTCTDGGDGTGSQVYGPDGRLLDGPAVLAKDGGHYRTVVYAPSGSSFTLTPRLSDVQQITAPATVPAAGGDSCTQRMLSIDATPGQALLLNTGDGSAVWVTDPGGGGEWTSVLDPSQAGKYLIAMSAAQSLTVAPLPANVLKAGSQTAITVQSDQPTTVPVFVAANQQLKIEVQGAGSIEPYVELLTADGRQIDSAYPSDLSSLATISPPDESAAGVYQLRISDWFNQSGSVTVTVTAE